MNSLSDGLISAAVPADGPITAIAPVPRPRLVMMSTAPTISGRMASGSHEGHRQRGSANSSQGHSCSDAGNSSETEFGLRASGRSELGQTIFWWVIAAGTALLAAALFAFVRITSLPPLIESDYCYLFTAAERLAAGHGLTAPPPVAPFQSWEWRADWAFLTQWPAGYPLILAGLRRVFGVTILHAAQVVSALACAAALTGWFLLALRSGRASPARVLLASVTAASACSMGGLFHPSTDVLVTAALPSLLLLVSGGRSLGRNGGAVRLATCGLLAGSLFWFRYASVFVPAALGLYLLTDCIRRREQWGNVAAFGIAAAIPIVALLLLNDEYGGGNAQEKLNLGRNLGFHFTWGLPLEIWRQFTNLNFYDHRPEAGYLLAAWPVVFVVAATLVPRCRLVLAESVRQPIVLAALCSVTAGLGMLLVATVLFGDKFHFAGLERYYQPLRPLYFILFVAPLLAIPWRSLAGGPCRAAAVVGLLLAGQWVVQQDWLRTYQRWSGAARPITPSGYWSRSFEPHAATLYGWLRDQNAPDLVVASNFHEYIALETQLPAIPIPPDRTALDRWIAAISAARGIDRPRVLFVLDPDNRWRGHWITSPAEVIESFSLKPAAAAPAELATLVFDYRSDQVARVGGWTPTAHCGASVPTGINRLPQLR